ncbi:hypothetical protein T8K17_19915 [Thalassobaculum sp. OXR-137]|uniref:hypothetical protein n=1 Tax=Thalassobaculum sp. OXR-137 TaxID=3100173 RepID=UPI002AC9025D|nr:hypothetical protein [Thalassobaculum sp. OXR-137]WPZ33489.1 hypothetical protein T8K17_19915 [Thalassobaculum sp. OXR-137]
MSASTPPELPTERPVRVGRTALDIAVAFAVEASLLWAVTDGRIDWPTALAGHLAFSLILVLFAVWETRRGRETRLLSWLAWMTLTLGPGGPVATALLAAMTLVFSRSARPFEEWYESLFPDDHESRSELLYRRLLEGREDAVAEGSVNSLTDVLFTGTTRAKQAVVALLARRFRSEFAPALQMALADPEASIRVQAATAASTIEERYHATRIELEDAVRAAPQDADALLSLARHLDDYAYAGVLDDDRQRSVMADALTAYRGANRRLGAREDIDLAIGRLMLRLDMIDEAEMHLSGLAMRCEDPRPTLWHAECLFRLRRFDDLRLVLDDPKLAQLGLSEEYTGINPVINLWQISALTAFQPLEAEP